MPHPLEQELRRLGSRARRYVLLRAGARGLMVLLAAVVVLGAVDYLFRFQDRGLRAMLSLGLLAIIAVAVRSFARSAQSSRYSPVQVAYRVEQKFPRLRGRLTSAVEFLGESEDDPRAGSAVLRRAVVSQASADVQRLNLDETVNAQPAKRSMGLAAVALIVCSAVLILAPHSSWMALSRLANPLSDAQWPRENQLVISDPIERLPAGQAFEVEVVDAAGAPLPDDAAMQYRFTSSDGETINESFPLQLVDKVLVARRDNVRQSFEYRAVGGDDHVMPWTMLEVVEPPAVRDAAVTLRFPSYTGWPDRPSDLNLRALRGTRVLLSATSTKPIVEAGVRMGDALISPASISADGYRITAPAVATEKSTAPKKNEEAAEDAPPPEFVVDKSGAFWLDLIDRDGFHSAEAPKYELTAVPDAAPSVDVRQPKSNVFVTADATLPLTILARDDLAIHQITLRYLRSDQSDKGEMTVVVDDGPEAVTAEQAEASAAENYIGERRELTYDWELKPLGLPAGAQVTFHLAAADYLPQTGQSTARRITVVTAEEMQDRLADRQATIFNELARVLELQRGARGHVTGLQVQLNQTGKLKKSDVDALQGARLNQQQVERELANDADGVRSQIVDLLDELKINKVDGPDAQRQMQEVLAMLEELAQGALPEANRELTSATKGAQIDAQNGDGTAKPSDATTGPQAVGAALKAAGGAQDEVIHALDRTLEEMKQWVNYRHFHREVGQLAKTQEHIAADTATVAAGTLTRPFAELDPQQRADLQKLAERQREVARRMDKLEQHMEETAATARQDDPLVADTIADALEHARGNGVSAKMRGAGQNVEQNQTGNARQQQQQVQEDLRELLDILSNRREHELTRLVKKLREAEQKLAELTTQQDGLRKKLAKAKAAAEAAPEDEARKEELKRLSREERKLQEEVERLARSLERLQADKAGQQTAKAAGKMGDSGASAEKGEAARAADLAEEAKRDLEEAQKELAQKRQQAEADLAQEQMARMEDAIASMITRQQELIEETQQYQARVAGGERNLTRAEAAGVRELSRQQLDLAEESAELAKTLAGAEVFQFVLDGIKRDMQTAGELLTRRETGAQTVAAQTAALERLEQLLAALKKDPPPDQPQEPKKEGGEGGPGGGGNQQAAIQRLAELKLLKSIQEQINRRTAALEEARKQNPDLSPDQQREYAALSEEQGRLAGIVANMLQVAERPEDDPDKLLADPPKAEEGAQAPEEKP